MKFLRWFLAITLSVLITFFLYNFIQPSSPKALPKIKDTTPVEYKSLTKEQLTIITSNCNKEVGDALEELSLLGDKVILLESESKEFKSLAYKFRELAKRYLSMEKPSDPICTVALSPSDSYISTTKYLIEGSRAKG